MLRGTLAVIVGYITMFIFSAVTFSVAYIVMGQDGAFKEGTTEVTMTWIVVSLVLSIVAALLGGVVAALIGRSPKRTPVKVLAGVVLVLGLLTAVMQMAATAPEQTEPVGEVSTMEAAAQAKQPVWMLIANPLIGAVGVLVGGSLISRQAKTAPATQPAA